MKSFIELYDDESGIMLAKVGGKDASEATKRALEMLSSFSKLEGGAHWIWFVDPKAGAAAKHVAPERALKRRGLSPDDAVAQSVERVAQFRENEP